jgi:hypothetical protein
MNASRLQDTAYLEQASRHKCYASPTPSRGQPFASSLLRRPGSRFRVLAEAAPDSPNAFCNPTPSSRLVTTLSTGLCLCTSNACTGVHSNQSFFTKCTPAPWHLAEARERALNAGLTWTRKQPNMHSNANARRSSGTHACTRVHICMYALSSTDGVLLPRRWWGHALFCTNSCLCKMLHKNTCPSGSFNITVQ